MTTVSNNVLVLISFVFSSWIIIEFDSKTKMEKNVTHNVTHVESFNLIGSLKISVGHEH